ECCDLVAGKMEDDAVARVLCRFPLVNKMASPTRYLSEDRSLLNAHLDARKNGLEFLAVYHSHPTSRPVPSRTDLGENYWEGLIHFIISLENIRPEVRGWWLTAGQYQPADWECIENEL